MAKQEYKMKIMDNVVVNVDIIVDIFENYLINIIMCIISIKSKCSLCRDIVMIFLHDIRMTQKSLYHSIPNVYNQ